MPKLSIITINFNNASGLRKTIESIVSQTFTDYEYIVIDGASTDGSVDVIKHYADKITYWVSEPDKGIYNAMNKGILKANGEYCLFLNSGDWLVDNRVLADFIIENFDEDIVSGNTYLWNNTVLELCKSISPNELTYDFLLDLVIIHQSTFIKKILFDKYGLYNEQLKIVSDWEFFIKALIVNNCTYINYDRLISYYDLNGISAQERWLEKQHQEREIVFKNLIPRVNKSYFALRKEIENKNKIITEYSNLKNGKFGYIVKFMLFLKSIF